MANRRSTRSDWDGCYKELFVEAGYQDEEKGRLVVGEDLPDGVFAVERLVTARKKKRRTEYLVLWEGYSREDASWVNDEDLTEFAIRSFCEPQPSARIVADCVICLLFLPSDSSGRQLLRVAVAIVTAMLSQHPELATRLLINPLLLPLTQLTSAIAPKESTSVLAGELETCIQNIHRILSVVEPFSTLLPSIVRNLPLLFEIWRITRLHSSHTSIQTKEVLVQVLTMSDTATALSFFYHLVGIPLPNELASVVFNELGPAVVITCSKNGVLGLHAQSSEGSHDVEEKNSGECRKMEDTASAIVTLLGDLKSCGVLGPCFLAVMGHLKMVLEKESFPADMTREDEQVVKDSRSVLVEWEAGRSRREGSSASSIMVLYVVAAVCEQLGCELLEQVDIISLLPVLAGVVGSHARCLKPSPLQNTLFFISSNSVLQDWGHFVDGLWHLPGKTHKYD